MSPRDPDFLQECHTLKCAIERHATLDGLRGSAEWATLEPRLRALLGTVRRHAAQRPPDPPAEPERIKAVHWNIEHGNWYAQVEAALLGRPELARADLVLFNEIDLGMARAGNRDVAADLAATLGLHAVWAPFFLETTRGRDDDLSTAGAAENQESLFGAALLSRWPIGEVRVVELPSPERYQFDVERMYGRHVAIVAEILRPEGAFVAASAHLDVHGTRAFRAQQMRLVLDTLRDERRPIVVAGDFNSHTFDRGRAWDPFLGAAVLMGAPTPALQARLLRPDRGASREWVFDVLRAQGFEWERWADFAPTLQVRFSRLDELNAFPRLLQHFAHTALQWAERRGQLRLDWFAGRGWKGGHGITARGLDGPGNASDHAPIAAWFE